MFFFSCIFRKIGISSPGQNLEKRIRPCKVNKKRIHPSTLIHVEQLEDRTLPSGSTFVPVFSSGSDAPPGIAECSVAWGDYDKDGNKDFLIAGGTYSGSITQLWHNQGDGTFAQAAVSLPGITNCSVAWGDYDNDGYQDILLAGFVSVTDRITQVWHNQGDGTFVQAAVSLPGVANCSVAWGDYDNDGYQDILLAGFVSATSRITQLWHNQGDGTFVQASVSLPGVAGYGSLCSVAWGDYDNDGYQDILLAGFDSATSRITQLWHNQGDGTFVQAYTFLPGFSAAWGDYNNDGKLDILVAGSTPHFSVWRNNGDGTFAPNTLVVLPSATDGYWGDYDKDDNLDILVIGIDYSDHDYCSLSTQVWRNQGDGTFVQNTADVLKGVTGCSGAWGDYNNDGYLDILLGGDGYSGWMPPTNPRSYFVTQIYCNQGVNNPPLITSANAVDVLENSTEVLTVIASDPDSDPITYSLLGGPDKSQFKIDSSSGLLAFSSAPDYEKPGDTNHDNVYEVTVQADDGHGHIARQLITVMVSDSNEAPIFVSSTQVNVPENTTEVQIVTASDPEKDPFTFTINGGPDQSRFSITTGGILTFQNAPDYENPDDANHDNAYEVIVQATDDNGHIAQQLITVTVTDVNEPPTFTSSDRVNIPENTTTVQTATVSDPENDSLTFTLSGGTDQSKFSITSGGILTFQKAPDYENPADTNYDHVYEVIVQVDDGNGHRVNQTVSVIVTNANDRPLAEANGPYFISGGQNLVLRSSGSLDQDLGDTLSYSWDLDNDGQYDDAEGTNPTVPWSTLIALGFNDGPGSHPIGLRVTDSQGLTGTDSAVVNLTNLFADDFNRVDSNPGPNWKQVLGSTVIKNNRLLTGPATLNLLQVKDIATTHVRVQADVTLSSNFGVQQAGLIARYGGPGNQNMYLGLLVATKGVNPSNAIYTASIYRILGGTRTLLASQTVSAGPGQLGFEVVGPSLKLFWKNVLVASAIDCALTAPGGIGISAGPNAFIDNFRSDQLIFDNPAMPFDDQFEHGESVPLTGPWLTPMGSFTEQGGKAVGGATGNLAILASAGQTDVAVQVDIALPATGSHSVGLVARYSGTGRKNLYLGYVGVANGKFTAYLTKFVNGTATLLSSAVLGTGTGILRLEVAGNLLKLFYNDKPVTYAYDTSLKTGTTGMWVSKGDSLDNFNVNAITATPETLPFTDTFTQANFSQVSRSWKEQIGNFAVQSSQLWASSATLNLATLVSLFQTDVSVSADVFLTGSGTQSAGLIARYTGSGDGNMYLGRITGNSHNFTAYIYKHVGGVWTLLASKAGLSGTGDLRFTVTGSSLQLFWNESLKVSKIDTSITGAGTVGIRSSGGVVYDNFQAE